MASQAFETYAIVDCDASPGSIRVIDVLYYNLPTARANKVEDYKRDLKNNHYSEYLSTSTKSLMIYHESRVFDSFDDAIDFIDNLGDIDNLMEVSSLHQQVHTYDRPDADFIETPSSPKNFSEDFHYVKDVFNSSRLLNSKLTGAENYIGTTYKVTFAYLGYA